MSFSAPPLRFTSVAATALALALALGAALAPTARAAEDPPPDSPAPEAEVASAPAPSSGWANPFDESLPDPGLLAVALQGGSHHGNGLGVSVGVTADAHLELKLSYAYWSEHSLAAIVKANVLPDAPLCPYFIAGYDLALVDLRYGITLFAHQVFGGFGLQARVTDRVFVGGEVAVYGAVAQRLVEKKDSYDMGPSNAPEVRAGFVAGVWLF